MACTVIKIYNTSDHSQQYGVIDDEIKSKFEPVHFSQCPVISTGQCAVFDISNQAKYVVLGQVTAGALINNCVSGPHGSIFQTVNLSKMVHQFRLDLGGKVGGSIAVSSGDSGFEIVSKEANLATT